MDDTQKYFDQVADKWEDMRRAFFGEGLRAASVRAAGIQPGHTVADIGTGTGFLAGAALDAGARVVGVDVSEGMLAQARSRFANRPFEARSGGVDALPLADDEADAVLANMVLHHAPEPARAVTEMARVLKPGGTLVITDADSHTHEWLRTEQHDRWLGFDRADVAGWFVAAGLEQVEVRDTPELCSPTSQCGTKAAITVFLARGRKPSNR